MAHLAGEFLSVPAGLELTGFGSKRGLACLLHFQEERQLTPANRKPASTKPRTNLYAPRLLNVSMPKLERRGAWATRIWFNGHRFDKQGRFMRF
jgi:hypothetical protein